MASFFLFVCFNKINEQLLEKILGQNEAFGVLGVVRSPGSLWAELC